MKGQCVRRVKAHGSLGLKCAIFRLLCLTGIATWRMNPMGSKAPDELLQRLSRHFLKSARRIEELGMIVSGVSEKIRSREPPREYS